ncbi:MAG: helix-turn-helix transcriptional regulator [Pseudonocardia sp.]
MAALEPRNFLQPCLLLLLRERPDHGYELAARLRPMHDGDGDAGAVYRTLRGLERMGLVRSEWQTSDVGPARRTYFITEDGIESLDEQAAGLDQTHDALHVFLDRYSRVVAADGREVSRHDSPHEHVHDRLPDQRGFQRDGRAGGLRAAQHPGRGPRR